MKARTAIPLGPFALTASSTDPFGNREVRGAWCILSADNRNTGKTYYSASVEGTNSNRMFASCAYGGIGYLTLVVDYSNPPLDGALLEARLWSDLVPDLIRLFVEPSLLGDYRSCLYQTHDKPGLFDGINRCHSSRVDGKQRNGDSSRCQFSLKGSAEALTGLERKCQSK